MEPLLYSDFLAKTFGQDALQSLRCSICLDYFESPVVLNCGHTFCKACIQGTANFILNQHSHLPPWKVFMCCPECRRQCNASQIARKGSTVPSNYPLASLLGSLNDISIPLKIDSSTNTESSSKSQQETQTSETEQEVTYDTKKLDELEDTILKLCRPENDAGNSIANKANSCKVVFEEGAYISAMLKTQKNAKTANHKNKCTFKKLNDKTTWLNALASKPRPSRRTSDIAILTNDPDVLRYYNSLS